MRRFRGLLAPAVLWVSSATAQAPVGPKPGTDSAVAVASTRYRAGGVRRFFLGDTYRDLWGTEIKVPVLNLQTFAGGLKPDKRGGGNQTKSVRFTTADGTEYVFRLVEKQNISYPKAFKGTIIEFISGDQISAHHPGAAVIAAPLLGTAGILHATPQLMVMPDDPLLGEFRSDFAGQLGMIEAYPNKPDHAPGFAGALAVIDSDSLQPLLNRSSAHRVDGPAFLTARLMDMLLNDWDRHYGQWKWARMSPDPGAAWQPIPRDRDKVFISYGGIVAKAGAVARNLIVFRPVYPSVRSLTFNSLEFDRRLLGGLEKPVWDSVARRLAERLTDSAIDAAVDGMPREYASSAPRLKSTLKARRDQLPLIADKFYRFLAEVVDVHLTDAPERAEITRIDDRYVDVSVRAAGTEVFHRRFDREETREIRLYLHGGDDQAVVRGEVARSIPLRVIGGNGENRLLDSSRVNGGTGSTHLYDQGKVSTVDYGPDTASNRRPYETVFGRRVLPGIDRGSRTGPFLGVADNGDLGVELRLGVANTRYGFRYRPYATRFGLSVEYATQVEGFRVTGALDRRREGSPWHLTTEARMSELEVVNFHGLGNASPDAASPLYEVRQHQWRLYPAIAWGFGPRSDVTLGPVLSYATTDSTPDRFLAATRPYGVGGFGQAGVRLGIRHDTRDKAGNPGRGVNLTAGGTWYPGAWDVRSAFGSIEADAAAYLTLPVPHRPVLAVRGGARKVFGDFPFAESAFIGGRTTLRTLERERFAGDAALYGGAELRLPVARVPLVLPLDLGIYGFAEAGRVYLDGASPGGWHDAVGGGFWIGVLNPGLSLNFELATRRGQTDLRMRTGVSF